ncbi:MAG TPA: UvrD-helicase domain-containing protein [Chitinophagaceae bacterium]|jgi:hypothetical protein
MSTNKLIIATAGSGKTTFLVNEALRQSGNILITTYTQANDAEIRRKIIEINKCVPSNITIQTWFSFLLQHGAKPFQGHLFEQQIKGMLLVNEQSAVRYTTKQGIKILYAEDKDLEKYYFTKSLKIFSDKLSKFVVRCNEKSDGDVIGRLSRIYSHIFVDEVQDLAGYDLEIIKLLFSSTSNVLLVGDPRQVTYLTHHDKLHSGYNDGQIDKFILDKCKKLKCEIDTSTLKYSHRNNSEICKFSSKLYLQYPVSEPCNCESCRNQNSVHNGIFLVRKSDLNHYRLLFTPTILRYKDAEDAEWNFGKAKGLGFNRVLIYPTDTIIQYLKTGNLTKTIRGKTVEAFDIAKFYVAITRARYSVGIVYDFNGDEVFIEGIQKFIIET